MSADPFKAHVDQVFAELDRRDYYQLLNVTRQAGPDEIRAAFHRVALSMHPDRFHSHPDAELRDKIYAIYKRITEGYRVLSDSRDRHDYDQALARGQLRLIRIERKKVGPPRAAAAIDDPRARRFFDLAVAAEHRNDFKTAKLNYKLAANLAGDHPAIKERLDHLEREGK